jgi:hypothetical protein
MKKWLGALAGSFLLIAAGFNLHSTIRSADAGVACSVPFNLTNGTTADASQVMANYNAILACLLNAAAAGANTDITALLGLTTPLAPTEGGSIVFAGVTPTASGNTIVIASTTPGGFSYTANYSVIFIAQATNVATQTLDVNAQGVENIYKQSPSGPTPLTGGEIATNQIVLATWDGTEFQINPVPNVTPGFGLSTNASQTAIQINTAKPPYGFDQPVNLGLQVFAVAGNLLQVNIVQANGAAPTATSSGPVLIPFRNPTLAQGTPTWVAVTASTSINTNATGASLGCLNNTPCRTYIVAFDNAGTVVPALYTASVPTPNVEIFPLDTGTLQSTTAIGGGATSAGVFYSPNGVTVSNSPFVILGWYDYATPLATAGTYTTNPDIIQLFGPQSKKPGDIVQGPFNGQNYTSVTGGTGWHATPLQAAITPTSKIDFVQGHATFTAGCGTGSTGFVGMGPTPVATSAATVIYAIGNTGTVNYPGFIEQMFEPAVIASTTYSLYVQSPGGGCAYNGTPGGNSTISLWQIRG